METIPAGAPHVLAEYDIDDRLLASIDTAGIAAFKRMCLALDDEGRVVVDVLRCTSGLAWLAEELAAVLIGQWMGHLLDTNPALEAYLQGLLAERGPAIAVTDETVAQAIMTTAQAAKR
jgi:hypothetical protein